MLNQDENIDDLFRKAVKEFPLKENIGNWDDVQSSLDNDLPKNIPAKKKMDLKIILLLLVLFFAGSIFTYLIMKAPASNTKTEVVANNTLLPAQTQAAQQVDKKEDSQKENVQSNSIIPIAGGNKISMQLSYNQLSPRIEKNGDNKITGKDIISNFNQLHFSNEASINTDNRNNKIIKNGQENKTGIIPQAATQNQPLTTGAIEKTPDNNLNPENKNVNRVKNIPFKPGFYFGAEAGIEFSQVKNQGLGQPGFHAGLLAGYQLSPVISIESGLLFTQKKYASEGVYFKPKLGAMPEGMLVKHVESAATFFEIPVNIKYNFSRKKNTVFATAGISSYLLANEKNKYDALISGQQQDVKSTYSEMKNYLGAEVNISAGYQHTLNMHTDIRIEPYLQIPLKGVGVGAMPVMSTGIHIILSHKK